MRALLLAFAVGMVGPTLRAQERSPAEVRLQAALHAEEVEGNLARAIELYNDVVRRYGRERDVAARALFYLGRTYEKQGSQEATRAYQRVVREYGDQSDVATQARERLAALQAAAPTVAGRGPVARRLLSSDETDINNLQMVMPSPDGRRVVYTHFGSDLWLYVRDLATGEEERLTSGRHIMNFSPIWSPDGRRVAFLEADLESGSGVIKIIDVASRNVITVPGTSAQHQSPRDWGGNLTPLDWSRDGRFLLCRTVADRRVGGIVLLPVDGGTIIPLADSVTPLSRATVSPDGRFVAYAAGASDSAQVFVRSLAGGERRQITEAPGGNGSPLWSPDGRALAYARSDGIWVVPMESGRPAGTPRLAYASISGTATLVLWTEAGGLHFSTWSSGSAAPYRFPVDPATGRPGAAPPDQLPSFPRTLSSFAFAWSPDMRRVAFVGYNSPEITIYSEDQHVLAAHRVDPQPAGLAGWSTDGREVLYASSDSLGVTWVAFDPAAGRVREYFPRRADRAVLSLSADGRRVLYVNQAGLFVADTGQAGGVLVAPTDQDGALLSRMRMMRSRISPRGDQVLFGRQSNLRTGQYDPAAGTVWVVASDGTGLRSVGTPVYVITSAVWDPSGRFIAYAGMADSTTSVLRVVEVATGAEREFRLPNPRAQFVGVTDWSPDGRYLGVVIPSGARAEYWVVQGLQAAR